MHPVCRSIRGDNCHWTRSDGRSETRALSRRGEAAESFFAAMRARSSTSVPLCRHHVRDRHQGERPAVDRMARREVHSAREAGVPIGLEHVDAEAIAARPDVGDAEPLRLVGVLFSTRTTKKAPRR